MVGYAERGEYAKKESIVTALGSITGLTGMSIDAMSETLGGASCIRPSAGGGVFGTMRRLDCHPGLLTGNLGRKGEQALKMIMPSIGLSLFNRVIRKVRVRTNGENCDLVVYVAGSSPSVRTRYLGHLHGKLMSKVLVTSAKRGAELVHSVGTGKITIIRLIEGRSEGFDSMRTSYFSYKCRTTGCLCGGKYAGVNFVGKSARFAPCTRHCEKCRGTVGRLDLGRCRIRSKLPHKGCFGSNCGNMRQLGRTFSSMSKVVITTSVRKVKMLQTLGRDKGGIPRRIGIVDLANRTVKKVLRATVASVRLPNHRVKRETTSVVLRSVRTTSSRGPDMRRVIFKAGLVRQRAA